MRVVAGTTDVMGLVWLGQSPDELKKSYRKKVVPGLQYN